ncbi:hypothetical protein AVDCRST_MAG81-902 [uncultured Synechococcales cyanobacterium]|uniref:Uncharacterized protein n=1 Tax=uncultured Synechococcales cyanobacterium TaxID=1936017 RepID=A0A6J4V1H3_9CYAN|nr:hypothetical protein AVDCRST_MAG81-902 [uncultured Synechococcales cyanobacterium]
MLTTAELRWFYSGIMPISINEWFTHDCPGEHLTPPTQREDLYLTTPGCECLGIKLRQDHLEIKWRQSGLGVWELVYGLAGQAEQWVKWICEPSPDKILPEANLTKGRWISVTKVRSQRKYEVLSDQSLIAVAIEQPVNLGCTVELTKLKVAGNTWWSLAFEAFGEDKALINTLKVVTNYLLSNYQGPILQAQDSFAYPNWLAEVVSG